MPSSRALKLLESMRESKSGWTSPEIIRVYESFGFEIREGRKHIVVIHPEYRELRATVSRSSGELAPGYARTVVKTIDRLVELKGNSEEKRK